MSATMKGPASGVRAGPRAKGDPASRAPVAGAGTVRRLPLANAAAMDPDLERDAEALHRALGELIRVYQFRDRDRICCYDVSVTQCYALEALVLAGPMTLNEVAGRLYLDKSTASRVVDALERKGYLQREPHPDDGRALRISATEAGAALVSRIETEILEEEMRLLADFEPEVRRAMARLIGRLAAAAAARVDTRGGNCCRID